MARRNAEPRIAAHLGRPETPEETAARKAENSRNYRQSQSFKNLIFALVVSLAIVAVVYFIVPRGEVDNAPQPDVAAIASQVADQYERTVVTPDAPEGWTTNIAEIEPGSPSVWTINYNSIPDAGHAYIRFAQAFDGDEVWAAQELRGTQPTGTVTINGVEFTEYVVKDPSSTSNISYALGVQAGTDFVLLYGSASAEITAQLAEHVADDIAALQQEGATHE